MREVKHSSGRDFYDDGYSSEEEEIKNRIDFSRVTFQGREKELRALNAAYDSLAVVSDGPVETEKVPILLVSGNSGTGKSTLLSQFFEGLKGRPEIASGAEPLCLTGKYNEFTYAEPFSAIADAMSGWVSSILHGDQDYLACVRKDLKKKMGNELGVLATVVPELGLISATKKKNSCGLGTQENAWNRLKYAFQSFFTAVCTKRNPVILFLDDLQWVDLASLELIESLLADTSLHHLMFVGGIRDDEITDDHPVAELMKTMASLRKVENLKLENLSLETTENILAELLELGIEEIADLALKIYNKTGGNIFFTKQAIDELDRKNILYYCNISFQWRWHLEKVDQGMTDNVVATLLAKIKTAPKELQKALSTAAYTRSSFDVDTLQVLMEYSGNYIRRDALVETLESAVLKGLLSSHAGSTVFKFSHDRIQQAAYMLVPEGGERSALCIALGKKLYEMGKESEESWMLFVSADHLNANSLQHIDPLFMAGLNLEVGELSMDVAAFAQASIYLKKGIAAAESLNCPWQDHYTLLLKLYRAQADAELCQGHYDYGHECAQKVLQQATDISDKLPTYISLTHALGRQDRQDEALAFCRNVAIEMGLYPKKFRPYHLVKLLSWVKAYFKDHSDGDILKLHQMEDETKLNELSILQQVGFRGKFADQRLDFLIGTLMVIKIGLTEGLSVYTMQSLPAYAALLLMTGDDDGSLRISRLMRYLSARYDVESECMVAMTHGFFVDAWRSPHSEVIQIFRRGYISGMQAGEIEGAFMNEFGLVQAAFLAGYPLQTLERSARESVEQIKFYGVESVLGFQNSYKVLIQCLTGSKNYVDVFKACESGQCAGAKEVHNRNRVLVSQLALLQLAVFFGEFEMAEKVVKLVEKSFVHSGASYAGALVRWVFGFLTASCLARKTKLRKYVKQALKMLNEMKRCRRPLAGSSVHRLHMMEAERKALLGRSDLKVAHAYNVAISSAEDSGCIQDVALCCELAGETFLGRGDEILATRYFSKARAHYRSWGALAKVRQLEKERGPELTDESEVEVVSSIRQRMILNVVMR